MWLVASAAKVGAAKAKVVSKKPQATAAFALTLLESLISSSIPTPPAMSRTE
jgi:hypothetical protein